VSVTYSRLDGKHLLESWIQLLALAAHDPVRDWSAVCIGRMRKGTSTRVEGLGPPRDRGPAVEVLRELVAIYDAGRREPIPLPIKTSYAWAAARYGGEDPVTEARYRWKSSDRFPGEDQAPAHARAWGKGAALDELMQPVRRGEECDGEDNRLGAYAARVWLPMLRAERKTL
jgi:exodeoxyribonuclease V gamma subunit